MLTQMELVTGIMGLLDKMGVKDANSRQFNSVIQAANRIIAEFDKPTVLAKDGMGLKAWLESDDTGASSEAMARALCGNTVPRSMEELRDGVVPYPHDPDDFGRCYRFLRAVPIGKEREQGPAAMATRGGVWLEFALHWDELERLYWNELPTGKCPKLFERMKQLIKEGEDATDRGEKQGN